MFYTTIGGWTQEIFLSVWCGITTGRGPLAGTVEDTEDGDFGGREAVDRDEGGE